jgi:glycosyltransferase involved in cell wall biosynthesis
MEEIVKNSSIVVLPSYREGLPKSLCEAAACGRPVITTNVPGCRDAIIPNKTGFLVELRNKNQLLEKIKILINNPKLAEVMSINARKLAENKFDKNKIVADHLGIYREFN